MQKNDIIPFGYGDNLVRVIKDEKTGEPFWVAKDICEILDLKNVSRSMDKLDEDEKLMFKIVISGQKRDMICINESGLYTLILRSNKSEAKKFKKWVTSEVLPSIRKNGSYGSATLTNRDGAFIHQFIKTQQETNNILLKNMEIQTKLLQTLVQNQDDKPKTITKDQMKKIRSNIFILLPIVSECQPNKSESEITRQLYTELNARFGVTSYYDIARDDFDEVIELQQSAITHWEEKRDLIHEQQKVDLRKSKQEIVRLRSPASGY